MLIIVAGSGQVASRTAGDICQTHLYAIIPSIGVIVWEGSTSVEE